MEEDDAPDLVVVVVVDDDPVELVPGLGHVPHANSQLIAIHSAFDWNEITNTLAWTYIAIIPDILRWMPRIDTIHADHNIHS